MTVPFLLRIPLALAVVVALVAGTYPNGLAAAARDLRDYTALTGEMSDLAERDADLAARTAELRERLVAKEALARELVAGRLSLEMATARFLTLNGDDPQALQFLHGRYDGSTLEEKVARNVIDYALVSAALSGSGREAEVIAGLDRQFRQRYGHPR